MSLRSLTPCYWHCYIRSSTNMPKLSFVTICIDTGVSGPEEIILLRHHDRLARVSLWCMP